MQKIGSSTTTANAAGEYTEGNPGSGINATLITAAWLNAIQRELVNLIQGASLTLNPADDSQVLKAIQALQTAMSTWTKITGKPTTVAGYGITDAFTKTETSSAIQTAVAGLVDSSPGALDTLKELATALGNDPSFATTMTNALAGKASKATTLAGYGIVDAYSKSDLDTARSAADIDALRINGPYIVAASTLGTLPYAGAIGTLLHQERGSSSGRWQLFNDSVGTIYTRSAQLGSGTWLGWGELQMSSSIAFTYLYPNGGNAASPASISNNSRYVETNPFGSAPVICIPQILVSGVWETVAVTSPGTSTDNTFGVLAAGRVADIIVRTGTGGLATSTAVSGIGTYPTQPASNITSAQCRVQVWRIKG
ncbi:hypothetical protein QZH45_11425 [Pseudomonas corrugata]|uniref:hypothetical protein n=1 Tax=Pseudomonas corrugata TaxID=47879 RepID=UPI0006D8BDD5|nr:hypothetical protein [Pseudomonas corrugata]